MVEGGGRDVPLRQIKTQKPNQNQSETMNTTLNISIDTAQVALVVSSLKDDELALLMRALAACAHGEDVEPFLNTSGLVIAYGLLSPPITQSVQRVTTLRANGAKGGRPRKQAKPDAAGSDLVSTKKSKKEELSPTPPIEEKIKKNNNITLSPCACEGDGETNPPASVAPLAQVAVLEWEELHERMLQEQPWLDELCMSRGISRGEMTTYVQDFITYLRERDLRETLQHAKSHFVNQLPYIIKIFKTQHNHEKQHSKNRQEYPADPVARRESERESRRQEVCLAIAELRAKSQRPVAVPF